MLLFRETSRFFLNYLSYIGMIILPSTIRDEEEKSHETFIVLILEKEHVVAVFLEYEIVIRQNKFCLHFSLSIILCYVLISLFLGMINLDRYC